MSMFTAKIPDYIYGLLFNTKVIPFETFKDKTQITYADVFDLLWEHCTAYIEISYFRTDGWRYTIDIAGEDCIDSNEGDESGCGYFDYWEEAACASIKKAVSWLCIQKEKAVEDAVAQLQIEEVPDENNSSQDTAEAHFTIADVFNHESIIITDPCYLLSDSEWLHLMRHINDKERASEYFEQIGIHGFAVPTLYGDWGCTTYVVSPELNVRNIILSGNEIEDKLHVAGTFCADSGNVCVLNFHDLENYLYKRHKDFSSLNLPSRVFTKVEDFTGEVAIFDVPCPGEKYFKYRHLILDGSPKTKYFTKQTSL